MQGAPQHPCVPVLLYRRREVRGKPLDFRVYCFGRRQCEACRRPWGTAAEMPNTASLTLPTSIEEGLTPVPSHLFRSASCRKSQKAKWTNASATVHPFGKRRPKS